MMSSDEFRAIVREEVEAALARRWPRGPKIRPPVDATPPLDVGAALERVAPRTHPATGAAYVTQGDVLRALGVPKARWQTLAGVVAVELRRRGWQAGARVRLGGRDGARVVPYYQGRSDAAPG